MIVKEFIEDYLIKQIGEIKDRYPYFAFLLMAVGIEFLGKCLNKFEKWDELGHAKDDFNLGLEQFPDKYKKLSLYEDLRCGMAHSFQPNNGLKISNVGGNDSTCISCDEFYIAFKTACEKVSSGEVPMPKKNLYGDFLEVCEDGLQSISGATQNDVSVKEQY